MEEGTVSQKHFRSCALLTGNGSRLSTRRSSEIRALPRTHRSGEVQPGCDPNYRCRALSSIVFAQVVACVSEAEKPMKVFDSGMPEEAYWNSLFDTPGILRWLNLKTTALHIAEIGCGYGTFTVPVARECSGEVLAFDIDPDMLETTEKNAQLAGLQNIKYFVRDILETGTGLKSNSVGMVLLFNILLFKDRRTMLKEAARILAPSGIVAIIHWRKDVATPRGPSMQLRPDEEAIREAIRGLDLQLYYEGRILVPYHWGIQLSKGVHNSRSG